MDILILILATWRLTSLIVNEEGPYHSLARFRHWVGLRYDEMSVPYGTNELASGLSCLWCASVWCGAAWAVLYWIAPNLTLMLALPLALSAGAVLVDEYVQRY